LAPLYEQQNSLKRRSEDISGLILKMERTEKKEKAALMSRICSKGQSFKSKDLELRRALQEVDDQLEEKNEDLKNFESFTRSEYERSQAGRSSHLDKTNTDIYVSGLKFDLVAIRGQARHLEHVFQQANELRAAEVESYNIWRREQTQTQNQHPSSTKESPESPAGEALAIDCHLCSKSYTQLADWLQHVRGKKHKSKIQALESSFVKSVVDDPVLLYDDGDLASVLTSHRMGHCTGMFEKFEIELKLFKHLPRSTLIALKFGSEDIKTLVNIQELLIEEDDDTTKDVELYNSFISCRYIKSNMQGEGAIQTVEESDGSWLTKGVDVRLVGLTSKGSWNEKEGIVDQMLPSGRVAVLIDGKKLSLKPENLKPLVKASTPVQPDGQSAKKTVFERIRDGVDDFTSRLPNFHKDGPVDIENLQGLSRRVFECLERCW